MAKLVIIIIIIIGFIFTVIGNIRICNIVHWYKKYKKTRLTTLKSSSDYHVGFSIKGEDEVDGEVDGKDGGEDCGEDDGDGNSEVPAPAHTSPYQPMDTT